MLDIAAVAVLVTTVLSLALSWLFDEKALLDTLKAESWSALWSDMSSRNRRALILAMVVTMAAIIVAVVLAVAVLLSACPGGDC